MTTKIKFGREMMSSERRATRKVLGFKLFSRDRVAILIAPEIGLWDCAFTRAPDVRVDLKLLLENDLYRVIDTQGIITLYSSSRIRILIRCPNNIYSVVGGFCNIRPRLLITGSWARKIFKYNRVTDSRALKYNQASDRSGLELGRVSLGKIRRPSNRR